MKRGMINRRTTLAHHFLDLPVADRICHIPAHAPEDDIVLKMTPFELHRHHLPRRPSGLIIYHPVADENLRQNWCSSTGAKREADGEPERRDGMQDQASLRTTRAYIALEQRPCRRWYPIHVRADPVHLAAM
jgi:hypothetical protein